MKKNKILTLLLALPVFAFSQSLSYNELGFIFAKDDGYGTARFEAMGGAFGALGGDESAFSINPAGSAVSKYSSSSATFSNTNTKYEASYYGNSSNYDTNVFNFTQAGSILSFNSTSSKEWTRFALTFNYKIKSDYDAFYQVNGNSSSPNYTQHFMDNAVPRNEFNQAIQQDISSSRNGISSVFNMGFSALHGNKLHLGGGIHFHNFNFNRVTQLQENNKDTEENILIANELVDSYIQGNGVSFSFGFIYKLNQNVRFGLAYETPTWYNEITEDYYNRIELNSIPNKDIPYGFESSQDFYVYDFRTNSRITASGAYIFGKQGLISFDYTYKDFTNMAFSGGNFFDINEGFEREYRNTNTFNIGTEWRFDRLSVRGGYLYEENPNTVAAKGGTNSDNNTQGYSLGLGYDFGSILIDLSYRNTDRQEFESIYSIGDVAINSNACRFSGTIRINL